MEQEERDGVGIQVIDLNMAFGAQKVLSSLSFNIHPGETFVIMGPSGSGKSVLLKNIIGLIKPSSGQVLIDGLDASDPTTRQSIITSLVFQSGALLNSLTVFDNLALYPREHRLYDSHTIQKKVEHTLGILSLGDASHKYPSELSGGMRKRVAIARALMTEPQLLLYDEPTSELDPIMSATITEIIGTLGKTRPVTSVVVTHDRDLAMAIGERVALLIDGKLDTIDTPENIEKSPKESVSNFLNPTIDLSNPRFQTP